MQKEGRRTENRGRIAKARSAEAEVGRERERSRLSRDQRRDGRVRYRTWWPGILDMAGPGFRTSCLLQSRALKLCPVSCTPWLMNLIATLVLVRWSQESAGLNRWKGLGRL